MGDIIDDLSKRPGVRDAHARGRRTAIVTDDQIRGRIAALYVERHAAGLTRPTQWDLYAAVGLESARVRAIHREMLDSGVLPDLPLSQQQEAGLCGGREPAGPMLAPRRPGVPAPAVKGDDRPYPLWDVVHEHMCRERRLRKWAPTPMVRTEGG